MLTLARFHGWPAGLLAMAVFVVPLCGQITGSLTPDYPTHLRGTVVNAITREPVPHALVHSPDNRFATMSNDEGRFDFTLPQVQTNPAQTPFGSQPAQPQFQPMTVNRPYALMARKPGYLENFDGQEQIAIEPTQEEVSIPLVPEARVIGRVIPSGTDAAEGIQVALYRRSNQGGRERWDLSNPESTARSHGEFRFANLPPGSYKLLTRESLDRDPLTSVPGDSQLFGFPPVYYSSASDFESAAIIRIFAGEILEATLAPVRREYYPIKLPVMSHAGIDQLQIEVWPQNHPGPGFSLNYDVRQHVVDGSLPDGAYTVLMRSFEPPAMTGMTNIVVSGAPVNGPSIALVPSVSVPVTVREEMQHRPEVSMTANSASGESFAANPGRPSYVNALLMPVDQFGSGQDVGLSLPTGPDDVSLRFENVSPGRYRIRVMVPGGYASSVVSGNTDLLHDPLVVAVGSAPEPIEITVRDDGVEVRGHVDGLPDSGAQGSTQNRRAPAWLAFPPGGRRRLGDRQPAVYFIPEPRGSSGQFTRISIMPGGEFQWGQVPPGSYRVLAFDHQEDELEFASEEQLRRFDSTARSIELAAGDKQTLKLSVTSTED